MNIYSLAAVSWLSNPELVLHVPAEQQCSLLLFLRAADEGGGRHSSASNMMASHNLIQLSYQIHVWHLTGCTPACRVCAVSIGLYGISLSVCCMPATAAALNQLSTGCAYSISYKLKISIPGIQQINPTQLLLCQPNVEKSSLFLGCPFLGFQFN